MTRFALVAAWGLALLALSLPPAYAEGLSKGSRTAAPIQMLPDAPREWSWSGVFLDVGAGGQASILNLNASAEEGSEFLNAHLNGLGAWDWTGNARVGVNFQPSGSPLVFGIFAGYSLGSVAVEGNAQIGGGPSGGIEAEITPTWDAGALVGFTGPNKSLMYVGYKFQMAEFDLRGTGAAEPAFDGLCASAARCSDDLQGHGFIAGFKMPVSPAFVLGVEYGYTRFDDINLSKVEGVRVDLEPEVHTVMLRGSVLLGPNLFGN